MTVISGRTAFITGAGGGLGTGIARALASEGASLALVDIHAELLEARKAEFVAQGVPCETCVVDVSDPNAVLGAAEYLAQCLGPISLSINNAGVGYVGAPLDQVPANDFEWVMAVNLFGVFNCIRALVPAMRRAGGGHVVNIASIDAVVCEPELHHAPYCASKAAVLMLSEGLASDLAGSGVGVSVVCPGLIKSNLPRSAANRLQRFGGAYERQGAAVFATEMARSGMCPEHAGRMVAQAIKDDQYLVFTHPEHGQRLRQREQMISQALTWSSRTKATFE